MAKTTIENLDSAIKKALTDYVNGITPSMEDVSKKIGQKGAAAVRKNARGVLGGTGKYARGWTSKLEKTRYSVTSIIYNKTQPSLAHLLENGHAKVGGGRVAGRPHIAPVEQEVVKEFEEKIEDVISGH